MTSQYVGCRNIWMGNSINLFPHTMTTQSDCNSVVNVHGNAPVGTVVNQEEGVQSTGEHVVTARKTLQIDDKTTANSKANWPHFAPPQPGEKNAVFNIGTLNGLPQNTGNNTFDFKGKDMYIDGKRMTDDDLDEESDVKIVSDDGKNRTTTHIEHARIPKK